LDTGCTKRAFGPWAQLELRGPDLVRVVDV
jgi:hypothetical protein